VFDTELCALMNKDPSRNMIYLEATPCCNPFNYTSALGEFVFDARTCTPARGRQANITKVSTYGISGLVVEYIVAIDVTRVRFPADAFALLLRDDLPMETLLVKSAAI
jgi:hypothetical protein